MTDKYTIRDFMVYFLTGLFLLLTLFYYFGISLLEYFKISQTFVKENSALTIFLLVPGLYILGHIIHGFDLLTFKIGRYIWDIKEKYPMKLKKFNILRFVDAINFIINGNKVIGILNSRQQDTREFYRRISKLQYKGKFDKSEYWCLMNDLFKGFTLISVGWAIFYCSKQYFYNTFVSLTFVILFWYRARHMAANFVSTVNYTWEWIEE